jgi:hypothetical protein
MEVMGVSGGESRGKVLFVISSFCLSREETM